MGETEKTADKIHKNMLIGDVVKLHPGAEKVIEKFFGPGCFTCPGIKVESLAFGAMLHGKNADQLVADLNRLFEE